MSTSTPTDNMVTPNTSEAERPVKNTIPSNTATARTLCVGAVKRLPQFKPMLCVDSGFITGPQDESDIKQIVIQNPPRLECSLPTANPTWEETINMPVLSVRCKNTSAELHKDRFGSGNRGRCIKLEHTWYTPREFETFCGRGSSKDWKKSIRFGGHSMHTLINEGILTPHATSCTCGNCCDDQEAVGPVRLFTPYKRRRRSTADCDLEKAKARRTRDYETDDINHTSNSNPSEDAWQAIAEDMSTPDYHLLEPAQPITVESSVPDASDVLKRLEDIGGQLMKIVSEYNACVEEVKRINACHIESIDQARADNALLAASMDTHVSALHTLDENDSRKCANCNRDASAECSLCRRTPYCSVFCQRKDWTQHQTSCLPVSSVENSSHQSVVFVVEDIHQ